MKQKAPQKILKLAGLGFLTVVAIAAGVYLGARTARAKWQEKQAGFYQLAGAFERAVIDDVPIFEDYADRTIEKKLRRYLQADHMKIAQLSAKLGNYSPFAKEEEIQAAFHAKTLVSVPATREALYYYYNVPVSHRYLRPAAQHALELITKRLHDKLKSLAPQGGVVKLAVSSALRTSGYQKSVRKKNQNAVIESTHSYGISFDLFYEDYYVSFSSLDSSVAPAWVTGLYGDSLEKLRVKYGFLLGDALRRQLHTLLHQVLVELQEEGVLYAILEKRQKCYHITALP